jgi:hypothetical protein
MFFLTPDFPRQADRKSAPILLFSALVLSLPLKVIPEKLLLLSLDTLYAIVRGHCLLDHILYRVAPVVSHRLLLDVLLLV